MKWVGSSNLQKMFSSILLYSFIQEQFSFYLYLFISYRIYNTLLTVHVL